MLISLCIVFIQELSVTVKDTICFSIRDRVCFHSLLLLKRIQVKKYIKK